MIRVKNFLPTFFCTESVSHQYNPVSVRLCPENAFVKNAVQCGGALLKKGAKGYRLKSVHKSLMKNKSKLKIRENSKSENVFAEVVKALSKYSTVHCPYPHKQIEKTKKYRV